MDQTKTIWVIANWKSNKTITEAIDWVEQVGPKLPKKDNLKIVVCPTFLAIEEVKKKILVGNYPLLVGAQDLSPYEPGPHTGEEAAQLLKGIVEIVILGHWERRHEFGETDQMVAEKAAEAIKNQITPVVCVQNEDVLLPESVNLVAYEPIFAIGTGQPDDPDSANSIAGKLKQKHGENLTVLYGGSVNSQNVKLFFEQENLSGVLVGGSSLDPVEFLKIIEVASGV